MGKAEKELLQTYIHSRKIAVEGRPARTQPYELAPEYIANNMWEFDLENDNILSQLIAKRPDYIEQYIGRLKNLDTNGPRNGDIGHILKPQPQLSKYFSTEQLSGLDQSFVIELLSKKPEVYEYFKEREFKYSEKYALLTNRPDVFFEIFPDFEFQKEHFRMFMERRPDAVALVQDRLHTLDKETVIGHLIQRPDNYKYFEKNLSKIWAYHLAELIRRTFNKDDILSRFPTERRVEIFAHTLLAIPYTHISQLLNKYPELASPAYEYIKTMKPFTLRDNYIYFGGEREEVAMRNRHMKHREGIFHMWFIQNPELAAKYMPELVDYFNK